VGTDSQPNRPILLKSGFNRSQACHFLIMAHKLAWYQKVHTPQADLFQKRYPSYKPETAKISYLDIKVLLSGKTASFFSGTHRLT
jgi:hypothetical protein